MQFTADGETHAQLEELRALMRHQIPDRDVGKILAKAISVLLERVRKQKFAATSAPRSLPTTPPPNEHTSRHVPAAIRREVWSRDGGRCTYVSEGGRRCDSKEFLEFDHAEGWSNTKRHSIAAITLRCRAHNQLRARQDFGEKYMAQFRRTGFKSSREAREARRLAEIAIKREACVNLWREAGFRGEMYAWETLADHYTTYYLNYSTYHSDKAPPPQLGIVPPVELYAWLELEKLNWHEDGSEDQYNVPRMHQDDLVNDVMNEEQRRDARALAERYAQIIWPRRIRGDGDVCRLIPQFAGDPEPYGSDPSPR